MKTLEVDDITEAKGLRCRMATESYKNPSGLRADIKVKEWLEV